MFALEFHGEVNHKETRVMVLSSSKDRMILAWIILTQCPRVMDGRDRQMVRKTDGQTHYS